MTNVICMKWGSRYSPKYVDVLCRGVRENLDRDHRFVCLTDDPAGIEEDMEMLPLPMRGIPEDQVRRGGWPKLMVFQSPFHDLEGPTLFLDLDVVVTGSLDAFFDLSPERGLMIIRDWLPRLQGLYRRRGWIGNSSVFRFEAGGQGQIFDRFRADPHAAFSSFRNEQRFLTNHAEDVGYWPEEWCRSFKRHCMERRFLSMKRNVRVPEGARVVVFHGNPKPDDLIKGVRSDSGFWKDGEAVHWVVDYWARHGDMSGNKDRGRNLSST